MVKQFSTARNIQRDSQSYIEKRRGGREIKEQMLIAMDGKIVTSGD